MAATTYGSLDHIFEKPLPENPTLLESLSPWNQIKSIKHNNLEKDSSNYTELFGELHFKDNHVLQSSSVSPLMPHSLSFQEISIEISNKEKNNSPDKNERSTATSYYHYPNRKQYRDNSDSSFSSMNSESLSLCTEGLGFESSDDVEECFDFQFQPSFCQEKISMCEGENSISWKEKESKRSRTSKGGSFPPPISCIGKTGKPWVCFKSYREDGRFILQEIRIPIQETLHACREDGRLKLQFIQSDEEIFEDEEEEDVCGFGEFSCQEYGEIDGEKDEKKISSNNVEDEDFR